MVLHAVDSSIESGDSSDTGAIRVMHERMPVLAGPLSTGGGLVFIAGTTEGGLRAIHSRSGTELWAAGAATVDSPIAFALE